MKRITMQNALILIALLVVFLGPLFLGFYLYKHDIRWTTKTTNRGELLKPMIAINTLRLMNDKEQLITRSDLHQTWWLMYVSRQPCGALCQQNLYKMQQVRLALGAKQTKLQCFVAIPKSFHDSNLDDALKNKFTTIQPLLITEKNPSIQFQALYLVDPMGNIMMRYAEQAEPKDILKDLKRLIHE